MLVLSRKTGERIVIGDNVTLTVVKVVGGRVELGIQAPRSVRVMREELTGPSPPAGRGAAQSRKSA